MPAVEEEDESDEELDDEPDEEVPPTPATRMNEATTPATEAETPFTPIPLVRRSSLARTQPIRLDYHQIEVEESTSRSGRDWSNATIFLWKS